MNPDVPQSEKEPVSKIEQIFLKGMLAVFAIALFAIAVIVISRSLSQTNNSQQTTLLSPLSQQTPMPSP
jgi:hypothetical protein